MIKQAFVEVEKGKVKYFDDMVIGIKSVEYWRGGEEGIYAQYTLLPFVNPEWDYIEYKGEEEYTLITREQVGNVEEWAKRHRIIVDMEEGKILEKGEDVTEEGIRKVLEEIYRR